MKRERNFSWVGLKGRLQVTWFIYSIGNRPESLTHARAKWDWFTIYLHIYLVPLLNQIIHALCSYRKNDTRATCTNSKGKKFKVIENKNRNLIPKYLWLKKIRFKIKHIITSHSQYICTILIKGWLAQKYLSFFQNLLIVRCMKNLWFVNQFIDQIGVSEIF